MMKTKIILILTILILSLTVSCSDNNDIDIESENVENEYQSCEEYAQNEEDGAGVCLRGEKEVNKGETYVYVFTVGRKNLDVNINQEVEWEIMFGELEVLNIETIMKEDYTISYCTIMAKEDFTEARIEAKSDRYNVGTVSTSSLAQMPIYLKK